jgi:hypothetical protein
MSSENEDRWMQCRMQRMRERRERSLPAFQQLWRSAQSGRPTSTARLRSGRLVLTSITAVLVAAVTGYWSFTQWQAHRRMERDFAALEGTLLTHWQSPSDVLFETVSWNEAAQP